MAKRKDYITLSKKHGVNPSITHCFICGKETGIALLGKLKGDAEAPRDIYDGLCDECQKVVDDGNKFVIEIKDGETDTKNPYRTGRYVAVKGEALPQYNSSIIYCEHTTFEKMFGEFINKEAI